MTAWLSGLFMYTCRTFQKVYILNIVRLAVMFMYEQLPHIGKAEAKMISSGSDAAAGIREYIKLPREKRKVGVVGIFPYKSFLLVFFQMV